uniref:Uncharacterized protein n=1 Tax=Anguilla anguilla TaxID=7936 RepID=A0A0E9VQ42_ANGAN
MVHMCTLNMLGVHMWFLNSHGFLNFTLFSYHTVHTIQTFS